MNIVLNMKAANLGFNFSLKMDHTKQHLELRNNKTQKNFWFENVLSMKIENFKK